MQDTLILLFTTLTWFGLSMVIFLTLSQFFPANKGYPAWRHDSFTDMIYWFFGSVVYGKITAIGVSAILAYLYAGDAAKILMFEQKGHPFWSDWPLLAQALIILLVTDVMMYWIHRIFHRTPFIWKFHAIHHSSRQVDWLSTSRFHPLNYVVYITLPLIITIIIGFSPDAFALLLPFNILFPG